MPALQDQANCQENYERFVARVKQTGEVWGLQSAAGWAQCPSNDHEGRDVLVFWSDRAYAARHVVEDWSAYVPATIPLEAFLTRWLPGMEGDRVLVGPNWDAHLCGLELEPRDVGQKFALT
jgi:hypothetical protein